MIRFQQVDIRCLLSLERQLSEFPADLLVLGNGYASPVACTLVRSPSWSRNDSNGLPSVTIP